MGFPLGLDLELPFLKNRKNNENNTRIKWWRLTRRTVVKWTGIMHMIDKIAKSIKT